MSRTRFAAAAAALIGAAACAPASRTAPAGAPASSAASAASAAASATAVSTTALLRTVPETTSYTRTSSYADVVTFLERLREVSNMRARVLAFGEIGRTTEGRPIPYVVAARPMITTAEEARASGKPVVYVQGNIHAGEVEGKEALQALLRDLALAPAPSVLDSIVLVAVPIYNADGNEKWGPQSQQRSAQNGPELVGQRPNAMGLDLNRDYIKAEAPETRASLAMIRAWDPDVFVDLHTTNGSYHGYQLTYSPSLHPGAALGDYTRELLRELRRRVRDRAGYETFDYGNFNDAGREISTDSLHSGWYTYDHRPRFGTNYYGLRNRVAVLSEAYSHDPLETRVKSTYAFVRQLLSLVAERAGDVRARGRAADEAAIAGRATVALRSALPTTAPAQPLRYELLERTGDTVRGPEPGVARGFRRTGRYVTRELPVFDRFVAIQTAPLPHGWLISSADTGAIALLARHGIQPTVWRGAPADVEEFIVDSIVRAPRPFQGHLETRLAGRWRAAAGLPATMMFVPARQPLGPLAAVLLDPESDDGIHTWNGFDHALAVERPFPVRRVRAAR